MRTEFRKGRISAKEYKKFINEKIVELVKLQESIGLDVLVHGIGLEQLKGLVVGDLLVLLLLDPAGGHLEVGILGLGLGFLAVHPLVVGW